MATYSMDLGLPRLPTLAAFRACRAHRIPLPRRRGCAGARPAVDDGAEFRCGSDDGLASEFSRVVNEAGPAADALRHRHPTHLLPPTAVVAAVIGALQRNDYPDPDAGVRTAFAFTKPYQAEDPTLPTPPRTARSWGGREEWLDPAAFSAQVHAAPYSTLLECDSWAPTSVLCFPSSRTEARAVQAVEVRTRTRRYPLSFCLERQEQGSMKGCWLVVGVRQGDYSV